MAANASNLSDALQLEKIQFGKWMNEAIAEADAGVRALDRELAAAGAYNSGRRPVLEMEIRFSKLAETPIQKVIAKRKELGRKFPDLLTQDQLNQLRDRLNHHVDAMVNGERTRMATSRGGGITASHEYQMKAHGLKVKISQELEELRLEARLGMHAEEKPMTIINISDSTIASLNLGTVVGDLTASIQTLNEHGQKDLADKIQTLTEAIAASTTVENAHRKELLEHLSFVSTEAALPPDRRKMGPLKSSVAFLRGGLTTATQLAALWPPIEEILKSTGILT